MAGTRGHRTDRLTSRLLGGEEASSASGDVVARTVGSRDAKSADSDLASRARQGDRGAYSELVERHRHIAFRVAYLVTGSAADAEDATQDGLVKAFTQIHRLRADAPFRPWLLRIVGNEARNRRRSESRRAHYESRAAGRREVGPDEDKPEWAGENIDIHRALLAAVNDLPEKERLVIGLRYFLGLTEEETAHAAGIPRGTVKSRTARAMGRLRPQIGGLGG